MAAQLKGPLTVITASLDIAQLFSDRADIQLILLGGQWDSKQRLFAGSATLSLVTRYRADIRHSRRLRAPCRAGAERQPGS
ncbi:DeoR faimly transcriptional regulator [Klebsiella pneumoniae]|uniref:DeoR faimly transcriptional regulator n=1 Tax=Klebsiella pneumoniae TaxID=573 RepID=A0A2X1Q9U8_KLEPN|nr:DeoR faimly transcriptional regulator [Klebsiella pneumoniae]